MRLRNLFTIGASALAGGLLLAGCGGSSGGGDDGSSTASFDVTDAPAGDLQKVEVTFDRIDLNPVNGEVQSISFDPKKIDLLTLQGSNAAELLGDTTVPSGNYEWVRIFVVGGSPDSEVTEDSGQVFELFIPGQQNRPDQSQGNRRFLQLSTDDDTLVVPNAGDADFTIDVELNKALTKRGNNPRTYLLRPSLRIVNNVEVDSITGEVDASLTTQAKCNDGDGETVEEGNSVYLYSGSGASPGDVNLTAAEDSSDDNPQPDHDSDDSDGNMEEVNPVSVANVSQQDDDAPLEYELGFIAEGDYTVAFTCESERDTSENDEDISFDQPQDVTVTADDNPEQVDFTNTSGSDGSS